MASFGETVKGLRLRRKLSQREVAASLGLTHTRWRDLETGMVHGTTRPTSVPRAEVEKIAVFFNYPADVLLQLAGHPVEPPKPAKKPTKQDAAVREIEEIFRGLPEAVQEVMLDVVRSMRKLSG